MISKQQALYGPTKHRGCAGFYEVCLCYYYVTKIAIGNAQQLVQSKKNTVFETKMVNNQNFVIRHYFKKNTLLTK